nr:type II toxin-antitoxin system VapC family toxin [Acidithiobacillus montserratensis]
MRLYLDNCMFNRPFDDQSNIRVLLETEAKLKIQEQIRSGIFDLVWSYILDYENEKNPYRERQNQIDHWRKYAQIDIQEEAEVILQANILYQLGLKKMDALHIACASIAKADYFLTTDKGILKKAVVVDMVSIKDPIDFIKEVFP